MSAQRSVGGCNSERGMAATDFANNCSTLNSWTVKKLKLFLTENCLPVAGKKTELKKLKDSFLQRRTLISNKSKSLFRGVTVINTSFTTNPPTDLYADISICQAYT